MQLPVKRMALTIFLLGIIIAAQWADTAGLHSFYNLPSATLLTIVKTAALLGLFGLFFGLKDESRLSSKSGIEAFRAAFLVIQSILLGVALSGSLSRRFTIVPTDAYLISSVGLSVYLLRVYWGLWRDRRNDVTEKL